MLKDRISKEDFISKYNSMSITELSKELKVSRPTINSLAKKYNLPFKKSGGYKPKKTAVISRHELERLYKTMRTSDLAKFLGVSTVTLLRIVKDNGIELKRVGHGVRQRKVVVEG